MDFWKNRPPAPNEFGGIRLIRVDKDRGLDAVITSNTLVGRDTHFTNRRTAACTGPDCSYCLDNVPARWHGYISICSTRLTSQAVLELTALAAQPIIDYQDRHGSLRGARLRASRKGNKHNSPVTCEVLPSDLDQRTLPRGVHLENFLAVIWHLDGKSQTGQGIPPPGPNIRDTLCGNPLEQTPHPPQLPLEPEPDPCPTLSPSTAKAAPWPPAAADATMPSPATAPASAADSTTASDATTPPKTPESKDPPPSSNT